MEVSLLGNGCFFSLKETIFGHAFATGQLVAHPVGSAADTIQHVIEVRPTFFRPPYGDYDSHVLTQANRLGLSIVLWNVDPRDWSRSGTNGIISGVLTQAGSGSIILLHDGGGDRSQTVAALPTIIESLQHQGLKLVTLQQMVNELHGMLTRPRPPLKPP